MKRTAIFMTLAAIIFMTGCSTVQVESDYDRSVDFSQYRTYRWIPHVKGTEDNPLMNDPLIEAHVKNAVNAEMAKKGLTKIDEGHPDFLIAYYFTTRDRVDVNHYYGYWYPQTTVYRYKEGTLIIDMVDRVEKQLIWRGWATDALVDRSRLNDQINYSVQQLLKKYPPNAKKEGAGW